MGVRQHLGLREAAHLFLHGGMGFIEAAVTERRRLGVFGDEFGGTPLEQPAIARLATASAVASSNSRTVGARDAEITEAHRLALAHRNAAGDLGGIFAGPDLQDEPVEFAEAAFRLEPPGPAGELTQRFDVGRKPGDAVRDVLVFVGADLVADGRTHGLFGCDQDPFGGGRHAVGSGDGIGGGVLREVVDVRHG